MGIFESNCQLFRKKTIHMLSIFYIYWTSPKKSFTRKLTNGLEKLKENPGPGNRISEHFVLPV